MVPIMPMTAIAIVLNNSLGKSMIAHTSAKFCHAGANVQARSSVRHAPSHTIGAAAGFAGSTNWLCVRPGLTRAIGLLPPSSGTM